MKRQSFRLQCGRAGCDVLSDHGRIVMIGSNQGNRPGMSGIADLAAMRAAVDGYNI